MEGPMRRLARKSRRLSRISPSAGAGMRRRIGGEIACIVA
jgi:hypothetical protein